MKMKAVVLDAFGDVSNFHLQEVPIPTPKQNEVRIRVKAASFNPVDCKIRKGSYGGDCPLVIGADCSGIIDEIGEGVTQFSIGDEVYGMPFGQCSNGSYAEYLCIPVQFIAKKPKHLSFEEASSLPLVSLTAYRAMIATHALEKKGPIFIAGAGGGVGSIAVQLAKHFHGGPIYTIAGSEESADFLMKTLKCKRDHIVLYKGLTLEDLQNKILSVNGGNLFGGCFDFVGKEMKQLCIALAAHSGHVASILPEDPNSSAPAWIQAGGLCFRKNLSFHSIFVGAESFSGGTSSWKIYQDHLDAITKLLDEKVLHPPVLKNVGSLSVETVQEAHRLLESGRVKGKLVMQVS